MVFSGRGRAPRDREVKEDFLEGKEDEMCSSRKVGSKGKNL